jgi:hypothetical protein
MTQGKRTPGTLTRDYLPVRLFLSLHGSWSPIFDNYKEITFFCQCIAEICLQIPGAVVLFEVCLYGGTDVKDSTRYG